MGLRVYWNGPELTICVVSPVGLTTVPWRRKVLAAQTAKPKGKMKRVRPKQRLQGGHEIAMGKILPRPQLRRRARIGIPGGKGNFRGSFGALDVVVGIRCPRCSNFTRKVKGGLRRPF